MSDRYLQHQNHLNETTLFLQKKFPNARFYSRHVGKFYSSRIFKSINNIRTIEQLKQWLYSTKNKFFISINSPGMADQYMIYKLTVGKIEIPIHLELETKTGSGKLSPAQIGWKKKCEMISVPYFVSRDKDVLYKDICTYINKIKKEIK